jgi:hypothetical protein
MATDPGFMVTITLMLAKEFNLKTCYEFVLSKRQLL